VVGNSQNMNRYIKKFAKGLVPKPVKKLLQESLRNVFVPPILVRNLLAHDGTFIVDVLGHDLVMQHTNRWIENDLFWHGLFSYEGASLRVWLALAKRARTIVDVGANTGLFSLTARCVNPNATIHAFEPIPEFYSTLERNNDANLAHIVIHRSALSNEPGVLPMFMPYEFAGNIYSSSLSMDHYLKCQQSAPRTFEVTVEVFDELAHRSAMEHVDLIKVDAEGFDFKVLMGMEQILSRDTPDVLIEISSYETGAGIEMLLPATKYRYFNICEDGTFALTDHLKPTAEWKSPTAEWNYLVCTPLSAELLSNELKSFRWVAS
jgi:FkbM family methyltransferase